MQGWYGPCSRGTVVDGNLFCVQWRMRLLEALDVGTLKYLVKQCRFLLKLHQAELAKDPTSHATGSSRSNLMAVHHTVKQLYGSAVAMDVAGLVTLTAPAITENY